MGTTSSGRRRTWSSKGRRDSVRAHAVGLLAAGPDTAPSALFGRRHELVVLEQALAGHPAGTGAVVDVVGPPGMGKSHLVDAFLAGTHPARVYVAGDLAFSGVPFAALSGSLRLAWEWANRARRRAAIGSAGDLAPLLGPVLGFDLPATKHSRAIEPARSQQCAPSWWPRCWATRQA